MTVRVRAIDISDYQHGSEGTRPIHWEQVAREGYVRAVLIKATDGLDWTNPWLETDAHGARAAGLKVGYYHFAEPGASPPEDQAKFFWAAIKDLPRDLCVMLDLEVTDGLSWGDLSDWGEGFLKLFEGQVHTLVLYSNLDWLENMPKAPWGHKLLFADPAKSIGTPPRRRLWGWQRSWTGSIPGIDGAVDVDELWLEAK